LSSSKAEKFTTQILGFSDEVIPHPADKVLFDDAKAPGLNDCKSDNIKNIARLAIVQPRELSLSSNRTLSAGWGINGQRPFTSRKSTRDARKLPEFEGEKPKTQVNIHVLKLNENEKFERKTIKEIHMTKTGAATTGTTAADGAPPPPLSERPDREGEIQSRKAQEMPKEGFFKRNLPWIATALVVIGLIATGVGFLMLFRISVMQQFTNPLIPQIGFFMVLGGGSLALVVFFTTLAHLISNRRPVEQLA